MDPRIGRVGELWVEGRFESRTKGDLSNEQTIDFNRDDGRRFLRTDRVEGGFPHPAVEPSSVKVLQDPKKTRLSSGALQVRPAKAC